MNAQEGQLVGSTPINVSKPTRRLLFYVALEKQTSKGFRCFLVDADHTSNQDLRELLRLEFDLPYDPAMSFLIESPEGGVIAPVQIGLIDNNQKYLLRVYDEFGEEEEEAVEEQTLWATYTTTQGRQYYYNTLTRETTWRKPDALKTV